jgi:hypothetical protein
MTFEAFIRRVHRIFAILFLLSIPPAAYASFQGDPASPSPVVYVPLFPLLVLTLTGTYQLAMPWIRHFRARRMSRGASGRA